jgi:hypothetical protein
MSQSDRIRIEDIQLDGQNLYREESYTDLTVGSIQVLVPVTTAGAEDPSRPKQFIGQTQILSAAGPLPLSAPIDASTLEEAIRKFPQAAKAAVDRLMDEAREMQRQEASRIVVPGSDKAGGGLLIP